MQLKRKVTVHWGIIRSSRRRILLIISKRLLWYDEKGVLGESGSGNLWKKERYTIDELTIQE